MDAVNDTQHLFSLPVALIFQNDTGLEEQHDLGYNTTTTGPANLSQHGHNWKKEEVVLGGLQKLEKVEDAIRKELKWTFIFHTYGFGCLFFILAFYTFFSILNIRSFISSRPFMSTINGFLCLLGSSRAASLFIDPYNLKENMPKLLGQVLWDLGFPSIISAFCLVQLAFLQFTQLQVGPEGLRKKSCLSLIVTAHFLLTIGMDIIVASHENLKIAKHVVHYVFLTWGVFLCSNFLYTGYKIMSMIRNIPGGLKHRELLDPTYKGIMELAILAPHNNLAGSVTAALLPTLCTPKIHQQDNTSLSTIGFKSDGNSRILESESIPMLEEIAVSSGDEISPKQLTRGSSFQNQTRNSQKFNLRPKLSLRSVTDDTKDDDSAQVKLSGLKSPKSGAQKNHSPKTFSLKARNEFDFNIKTVNGLAKRTENFVTTKSIHEFKNKIQQRTCFENENFRFSKEKKLRNNSVPNPEVEFVSIDHFIPEILVSAPSNLEDGDDVKAQEKKVNFAGNDRNKKTLTKLMNEISKDLNEMQILREEKSNKTNEIVEVHKSKKNKCESESENDLKNTAEEMDRFYDCRRESVTGRRGGQLSEGEYRKNACRKECSPSLSEIVSAIKEDVSICSTVTEITEGVQGRGKIIVEGHIFQERKKGKSLSWKKAMEDDEEDIATQECLLFPDTSTDMTLRSLLNHIAYMNKGTSGHSNSEDDLEKVRKSKVEWVLNITYITAMWGLMLCLSNMGKIYSPFGLPESRRGVSSSNSTYLQNILPTEASERGIFLSSWPWLWFQTFCRALELAMGCAMANITRQPAANHRYSRTLGFRQRDTFYNI